MIYFNVPIEQEFTIELIEKLNELEEIELEKVWEIISYVYNIWTLMDHIIDYYEENSSLPKEEIKKHEFAPADIQINDYLIKNGI